MSRTISFGWWVQIVPSAMVQSWVDKKYIKNSRVLCFQEGNSIAPGKDTIITKFVLKDKNGEETDHQWAGNAKDERHLRKIGYKSGKEYVCQVNGKILSKMMNEVNEWYDKVFEYVENWLKDKGLLKISKGSMQTGFCVENDPDHETVTEWGAPLGKSGNKVSQIKEKFGRVTVYFNDLTDEERGMVEAFAVVVELLYDCSTCFV